MTDGEQRIPDGFTLFPDRDTRWSADGTALTGGAPWRLLRLTSRGADRARDLLAGSPVGHPADAALARRLVRAGLAHPRPPDDVPTRMDAVDVVVPARDRLEELDRCLTSLGSSAAVLVVDDASADATALSRVARAHGARLVTLDRNVGPGGARNAGLAATTAPLVAFVDSDCCIDADQLAALARHFTDPMVGAVAPRVRPSARGSGVLAGLALSRSPLDLGDRPADVRPDGRLTYVPATALLVRRAAVEGVLGFAADLRYGEDVDLVWRLVDAGWVVRYDPTAVADHAEPDRWATWLSRRHRYGASAGPLARRHGARLAGPALSGLAAPVAAARQAAAGAIPPDIARRVAVTAPARTVRGLLRWLLPIWWPLLAVAAALPRRWGRRARPWACAGVVVPLATEWWTRRPGLDPGRWVVAAALDDVAYGSGVWRGCLRARTVTPLLPRLRSSREGQSGLSASPPPSSP